MKWIGLFCSMGIIAAGAASQECREDLFLERRGYPVEIEIDGDDLWIADGAGVRRVEAADPSHPVIVAQLFTPNAPSIAVERLDESRIALLTTEDLQIYDLTESEPRLAASLPTSGNDLLQLGSSLFIAGKTLTRVGIGESEIEIEHTVELSGEPVVSSVASGHLLLSIPSFGTYLFDVNLSEIGRIRVTGTSIEQTGTHVFLGDGDGIFSIDLSTPVAPRILQHLGGGIDARTMVVAGDLLYASGGAGTVHVVDIHEPHAMELVENLNVDLDVVAANETHLFSYAFQRDRFGDRVELSGTYLTIRSLEHEGLPVIGEIPGTGGPISGVATDGEIAWIADPPHLRAIDLVRRRELGSLRLEEPFDRIRSENGRLILYGRTFVHLVDPDPLAPRLLGTWPTLGIPGGGVTFSGPWLIEANRASGFHVLDVSNPAHIFQRGGIINDGRGQWQNVVGIPGWVYGIVNTGVKVVDLTGDPSAVRVVNFLGFGGPSDIDLFHSDPETFLLVLDTGFLHVLDLTIPSQPLEVASIEVGESSAIAVSERSAWILRTDATVIEVDLSTPSAPAIAEVIEGLRRGHAIAAAGDVLVGADHWSLSVLPRFGAAAVAAPRLIEQEETREVVQVGWNGVPTLETELEIATTPVFSSIEREWRTTEEGIEIEREAKTLWLRARFRSECSTGAWSTSLAINPKQGRSRAVRRP